MDWRPAHHKIIAQIADGLTTALSFAVSYYLWQGLRRALLPYKLGGEIIIDNPLMVIVVFLSIAWVIILDIMGAYSYQRFISFKKEMAIIFKTVGFGLLLLIGMIFILRLGYVARTWVIIFSLVNFGFLTLEKLLLFFVAQVIRQRGYNRKTVLVAGTGMRTRKFVDSVRRNFHWGLDIVGFLGPDPKQVGKEIFGKKILGTFRDIATVLHEHPVDEVIITVSSRRMNYIIDMIKTCEQEGLQVRMVSDFIGRLAKNIRADVIYGLPIISISYTPNYKIQMAVKRLIDIAVSSFLLVVFSPVLLVIAVAIKRSSPGPVFYQWNVVGFNKKPFTSWKFRSMVVGADSLKEKLMGANEMQGPVFKTKHDPRVTPVGRFLRKYSLDELPQLWSVLKGDMSLVGPRPAGPHELVQYEDWCRRKLSIKPGITCLWQVNGRNLITRFDDWVKMDLEYIDNWSLWLDIRILLKTIPAVLSGRGAS